MVNDDFAVPWRQTAGVGVSLAGRVLVAILFVLSGISKITAHAMVISYINSVGLPLPQVGFVIAIGVELVLVPVLVFGYQIRFVAAFIAAFCVVTAIFFYNDFADQNMLLHFLKKFAIAGGLLQVVAFGGGRFSLDARLARTRQG